MGLPLLHFGNYPWVALFHTFIEWLFGIKGAIESVSKISLRFLTSLTNVLLLPSQKGILPACQKYAMFSFCVKSSFASEDTSVGSNECFWQTFPKGKHESSPCPCGSWPLSNTILLIKCSHGPVCFKNRTPQISFISKVSTGTLIHMLFKRFLPWTFSLVFSRSKYFLLKSGWVVPLWLWSPYLIKIPRTQVLSCPLPVLRVSSASSLGVRQPVFRLPSLTLNENLGSVLSRASCNMSVNTYLEL